MFSIPLHNIITQPEKKASGQQLLLMATSYVPQRPSGLKQEKKWQERNSGVLQLRASHPLMPGDRQFAAPYSLPFWGTD